MQAYREGFVRTKVVIFSIFSNSGRCLVYAKPKWHAEQSFGPHTQGCGDMAIDILYIKSLCGSYNPSRSFEWLVESNNWMNQAWQGRIMAGGWKNRNFERRVLHSCWWGFRSIHSFLSFNCTYFHCKTLSGYCCLIMPTQNLQCN